MFRNDEEIYFFFSNKSNNIDSNKDNDKIPRDESNN